MLRPAQHRNRRFPHRACHISFVAFLEKRITRLVVPGATFISGERISLRTVESDDDEFLQRWHNDPAIRNGLMFTMPQNREQVESFIETDPENDDWLNLLVCLDEEPIGVVELNNIQYQRGELVCWLIPEYQGNGYATEAMSLLIDHAFDILGLHRVYGRILDSNGKSQALIKRLGFSKEGEFREHVFIGGEYRTLVWYGLLEDEWRARQGE